MNYDVLIVGGRPSGATLAARLGARQKKVLVLEKAIFPSLPNVPSSPAVHPGAMELLDEIGIPESAYASDHARMRHVRFNVAGLFSTVMRTPTLAAGRDYTYGVDRAVFDTACWHNLDRFPTVEKRQGFTVTDLVKEGQQVVGIVGNSNDGPSETIKARAVIGADGRFSFVARKCGAPVIEEQDTCTSTVYYADWAGVRPVCDEGPATFVYTTVRGLDVLFFAMPNGLYSVNTHQRSDRVDIGGKPENYYLNTLKSIPEVWRYLEKAERTTPLSGIKRIGNGYRQPSGPGWALVGDALHYKDPVDGQGIYDALLETKLLDQALSLWLSGARTWDDAMKAYRDDVWAATQPMFKTTVGRLKRELYDEPPWPVVRTLIRWTVTDPIYQETFLRILGRDLPPGRLTSKRLMAGCIQRGIARDALSLFKNTR
ncbi:MAG: FAD-dependent monooxygenase [Polyangiaceae bacterium]|nr:FAD-dependent monooxygenase [Polyangiaceae bacterium]